MNDVTREKLTSDFKALMDARSKSCSKTTSNHTGKSIAALRQRLGQKLEEGRRALSEQERILRGKAEEARASAEAYLREKPWATLGIAAGIGLVLGLLMRPRD